MTGYGRGEAALHGRSIVVEVRAVNNRYLDCAIKMPRAYIFAEDAMKTRVQAATSRGKVDVFVTLESTGADAVTVKVNHPVAAGYITALKELKETYQLLGMADLPMVARFPDVLQVEKAPENIEEAAGDICAVLDLALADFTGMREREGERLRADILARADAIEALVAKVEEQSPRTVAEYRTRLENRMREVLQNQQIEESRILTEAAIFADKVAVDEETVRLRSHLSQLRTLLSQGGPIGRKLDFLIQEFNREANTIGSKCNDLEISRYVIDMKAEIEKIREQVQNIE
ncbi:MAG TPA: YicC family protein [Candidatus Intestinimonas stercorigallinarum]|nr:YicC family protein [Candidatus Intestinimonas stercorigallinarum]